MCIGGIGLVLQYKSILYRSDLFDENGTRHKAMAKGLQVNTRATGPTCLTRMASKVMSMKSVKRL